MDPVLRQGLLYPPREGSLRGIVAWVGKWRVVPLVSPSLRGVEEELEKALRRKYLRTVEGIPGRGLGLTHQGAAYGAGAPVESMSIRGLSHRMLLHLGAHALLAGHPRLTVTAIGQRSLLLRLEPRGDEVLLSLREGRFYLGTVPLGKPGGEEGSLFPLPKQFRVSSLDLTDEEWLRVALFLLPPPRVWPRSPYWTRTLMDAALALGAGKRKEVLAGGGEALVYAGYAFRHKDQPWERVAKLVPRLAPYLPQDERGQGWLRQGYTEEEKDA